MHVGDEVWIFDEENLWVKAVIDAIEDQKARVSLESNFNEIRIIPIVDCFNEALIHPRNQEQDSSTSLHGPSLLTLSDDLSKLTHLNEPSILHELSERYSQNRIYTSIGSVLLAINPFQHLELYDLFHMESYREEAESIEAFDLGYVSEKSTKPLPPHVYSISARAYHDLRNNKRDQSILVSGESGAGKTETTKIVMQYLAHVGSPQYHTSVRSEEERKRAISKASSVTSSLSTSSTSSYTLGVSSIQQQVLQTNPILEAFGNACTLHNSNSSRFGKFIKMQFSEDGKLIGAFIQTYLLETVRLVHQAKGERNFHIFYQMCRGASTKQRELWSLKSTESYAYLNPSLERYANINSFSNRMKVEESDYEKDKRHFKETCHALSDVSISSDEQNHQLFPVLSAILHLGNVTFEDERVEECGMRARISMDSKESFSKACELLSMASEKLEKALCTRDIKAGMDEVVVDRNSSQAMDACDAFAKTLYSGLFQWLVDRLSESIDHSRESKKTIGILDIFGFEVFDTNGFEQLCINYANEALQSQFHRSVFTMEQYLYQTEGIIWERIDSATVSHCIDVFEDRPHGIFCLLDQECRIPGGTDIGLATKLYSYLISGSSRSPVKQKQRRYSLSKMDIQLYDEKSQDFVTFQATKMHQAHGEFIIRHFAGHVLYTVDGFVEKNREPFSLESNNIISLSSNPLLQSIYISNMASVADSNLDPVSSTSSRGSKRGSSQSRARSSASSRLKTPSLTSQFRSQLSNLLHVIDHTNAHYIRCLKPNDGGLSSSFNKHRIVEQLRSGGVLEVLRLTRAGYPVQMNHEEFLDRFRFVIIDITSLYSFSYINLVQFACAKLVEYTSIEVKDRNTVKSFLKSSVQSYIMNSRIEKSSVDSSAELEFRDVGVKLGFQIGKSKIFMKKNFYNMISQWRLHQRQISSIIIQRIIRGYLPRKYYMHFLKSVRTIQRYMRRIFTLRKYQREKELRYCLILQKWARCFIASNRFKRLKRGLTLLQINYRSKILHNRLSLVKRQRAVSMIGYFVLGWAKKLEYKLQLRRVVQIQTLFRTYQAKKIARSLRIERNSVNKLQDENQKLREELQKLRDQMKGEYEGNSEFTLAPTDKSKSIVLVKSGDSVVESHPIDLNAAHAEINRLAKHLLHMQIRYSNMLTLEGSIKDNVPSSSLTNYGNNGALTPKNVNIPDVNDDSSQSNMMVPFPESMKEARMHYQLLSNKIKKMNEKFYQLSIRKENEAKSRQNHALVSLNSGTNFHSGNSSMEEKILELQEQVSMLQRGMVNSYRESSRSQLHPPCTSNEISMPRWKKRPNCFDCGIAFSLLTRRHHCRACGNSFCHEHSSRMIAIWRRESYMMIEPETEPVPERVCDMCFFQHTQSRMHTASFHDSADYTYQTRVPRGMSYNTPPPFVPRSVYGGTYESLRPHPQVVNSNSTPMEYNISPQLRNEVPHLATGHSEVISNASGYGFQEQARSHSQARPEWNSVPRNVSSRTLYMVETMNS